MIESAPSKSEPTDPLEVGLRAAFGGNGGESSVLEVVSRLTGRAPQVLLRDESESDAPGPVVDASARHELPLPAGRGTYQVLGEIARGGMGAVLKAHDLDLGRDVAMKVLHPEHGSNASALRRFVEEAQLGGQLQHPGIVPVYELGLMADRRPYFTMKLVRGRTLSALLAARTSPEERRRHFLSIFEAVCRTVAYAHSRGVIHRDLKPANVMVGAFGEVQVMDWGLAKVLRAPGKRTPARAEESSVSELETVRSHDAGGSDSVEGTVIGTPACMPPEQARGALEALDERADVFALGGLLAQILTGRPVYERGDGGALERAARAKQGPIRAALAACSAEPELVELCGACLSPDPGDRPADAGVVAERLHAHLVSSDERAQRAQVEVAEAQARASAERRARRRTVGLAASALVTLVVGGAGWLRVADQRAERLRERIEGVDVALTEATGMQAGGRWMEAASAARRAVALAEAEGGGLAGKAARARALAADAATALEAARLDEENRALLAGLQEIRRPEGDAIYPTDWTTVDASYGEVFGRFGLTVDASSDEETARVLLARGIPVELAAALDEWSFVRREADDLVGSDRLSLLADRIDPDGDRVRVRRAIRELDPSTLSFFQQEAAELPVATLRLLGRALAAVGDQDEAAAVLRHGLLHSPDEFALHVDLARLLAADQSTEAAAHYTAALALRPESIEVRHELARALGPDPASRERAAELLRETAARFPDDPHIHLHLGWTYRDLERLDAAEGSFRRAIELDPRSGLPHLGLGQVLAARGQRDLAIASYRRAVERDASLAAAHRELGNALYARSFEGSGELPEAIGHLRRAVELDPDSRSGWSRLGLALTTDERVEDAIAVQRHVLGLEGAEAPDPDRPRREPTPSRSSDAAADCLSADVRDEPLTDAIGYARLGKTLSNAERYPEALDACRRAVELDPGSPYGYGALGATLVSMYRAAEAMEHLRHAVELDPGVHSFRHDLGRAHQSLGRYEQALEEYQRSLELRPCATAHYMMGTCHWWLGEHERAAECYREAIRLDPDFAWAHNALGQAFQALGDYGEAREHSLDALELAPDDPVIHFDVARAMYLLGDLEGAEEHFRAAVSLDPAYELALMSLGLTLALQDRNAEAVAHVEAAHALDPDDAWGLSNLVWVRTHAAGDAMDLDEAERAARRALELYPEKADPWAALGMVLYRRGAWKEAAACLRAGFLRVGDSLDFRAFYGFYLAMALHRVGAPAEAREAYDRTVGLSEVEAYPVLRRLRSEATELLGVETGSGG